MENQLEKGPQFQMHITRDNEGAICTKLKRKRVEVEDYEEVISDENDGDISDSDNDCVVLDDDGLRGPSGQNSGASAILKDKVTAKSQIQPTCSQSVAQSERSLAVATKPKAPAHAQAVLGYVSNTTLTENENIDRKIARALRCYQGSQFFAATKVVQVVRLVDAVLAIPLLAD